MSATPGPDPAGGVQLVEEPAPARSNGTGPHPVPPGPEDMPADERGALAPDGAGVPGPDGAGVPGPDGAGVPGPDDGLRPLPPAQALEYLRRYNAKPGNRASDPFLPSLGIYGWTGFEPCILTHLLTARPLLLIGPHGEGKTLFTRQMMAALAVPGIVYDANKALFEDVIGMPEPYYLQHVAPEDRPEALPVVQTPMVIWRQRYVCLDEFSRANPELQGKWFELIDRRTMMGMQTNVRWIVATANPARDYTGAYDLDKAGVDRFDWYLFVPRLVDQKPEVRKALLSRITFRSFWARDVWRDATIDVSRGPALPPALVIPPYEPSREEIRDPDFRRGAMRLQATLVLAESYLDDIAWRWGASVVEYVDAFAQAVKEAKYEISGRRHNDILVPDILAALAIEQARLGAGPGGLPRTAAEKVIGAMVVHMIPHAVLPEVVITPAQITAAHQLAAPLLRDERDPVFAMSIESDPIAKMVHLMRMTDVEQATLQGGVGQITDALQDPDRARALRAAAAISAALFLHGEGLVLDALAWPTLLQNLQKWLGNCVIEKPQAVVLGARPDQLAAWLDLLTPETTLDSLATQIAVRRLVPAARELPEPRAILAERGVVRAVLEEALSRYRREMAGTGD